MNRCPTCGEAISADHRACPRCGTAVGPRATPTEDAATLERPPQAPTPPVPTPPLMRGRFAAGTVIDRRFAIVDRLGGGGMGEVYRAEDLSLHQPVALKFLPKDVSGDPVSMQRIRDEVRLARRVSHPNVCRVHDIGESEGQLFISMELIEGEDLASLLRRIGRLPAEKAIEIARQVCAGLAAAHAAGVLHRDLKPANVMLDREGCAHITDFGIAVAGETVEAGELAGTPAYMAPEQLAGLGASVKSDLFSLGLVLYELVTGQRLFSGTSLAELSRQQREIDPVPPSRLAPDIRPQVEQVILRCLAREPEKRPASALAVLTALSGGDPLGAALAAGQIPSPQMVAAAPAIGAMRPAVAWACAASVLVSFGVYLALGDRLSATERARLRLPPAALVEKAREAIGALHPMAQWTGEAYDFDYDDDALRFATSAAGDVAGDPALAAAEEQLIVFWYRCSLDFLVPQDKTASVSRDDPPLREGDAMVMLDSGGRLLSFTTIPTPVTHATARAPDPTALLRLAGFDPSRVQPAEPRRTPTLFEDTRQAWRGALTIRPDLELTADAAFRAGQPVLFRVNAPWTRNVSTAVKPKAFFSADDAMPAFMLSVAVAALPLAWYNLRRGRGDRRGAFRLAALTFFSVLVVRVLTAGHVPIFAAERAMLLTGMAWGLYIGATTWLTYIALEPIARRVWP